MVDYDLWSDKSRENHFATEENSNSKLNNNYNDKDINEWKLYDNNKCYFV